MRIPALTACALLLSASLSGQARPAFEVASIRPSPEQVNQVNLGVQITGTQVRIAAMSLKDYIGVAYSVRPAQIQAPDWLSQVRYDIAATIPAGSGSEQVDEMLQSLLAERFGLTIHRESKELPVYAIVRTDGPAPQPVVETTAAAADAPVVIAASGTGGGVGVDLGGGSSFNLADNRIEIRRMTLASTAEMLERFLDRPVIDGTALAGRYDMTLNLPQEDYRALLVRSAINAGIGLPPLALRALEAGSTDPLSGPLRAYGLTLVQRRAPLDVIVVDSMNRTPTEN